MRIEVAATPDCSTLRLEGPLTRNSASAVRSATLGLRPGGHLHLDLRRISELDAPGFGSLLGVIRRALEQRANISLAATGPLLGRLCAAGIDGIVDLQPLDAHASRPRHPRYGPSRPQTDPGQHRDSELDPAGLW